MISKTNSPNHYHPQGGCVRVILDTCENHMKASSKKLSSFATRIVEVREMLRRESRVHYEARLALRQKGKRQVEAHSIYGWHSVGTSNWIARGCELRHDPYSLGAAVPSWSKTKKKKNRKVEEEGERVNYAHVPADLDSGAAHFPFGPLGLSTRKGVGHNTKLVDRHRVNALVDDAAKAAPSQHKRRQRDLDEQWSGTTFKLTLLQSLASKLRLKVAFDSLAGEITRRSIKSRLLNKRVAYMRMLWLRAGRLRRGDCDF